MKTSSVSIIAPEEKKAKVIIMKNPNGYGSVMKLSGNRRKPYMAYKTITVSDGKFIPPALKKRLQNARGTIGDASDGDVLNELLDIGTEIVPMKDILENMADFLIGQDFKAVRKKKAIGYFKTAKEAHIALAEANRDNITLSENQTFADVYRMAFDDAGIENKSLATVRHYHSAFANCRAIHNMKVNDITAQTLQDVIDSFVGSSASKQRIIITVMRLVMKYATSRDMCARDVSQFVHTSKTKNASERKPFTPEEMEVLKENGCTDIIYLILTGLRISEYLSLEDTQSDILTVDGTKNKTSKRIVPLHPALKGIKLKWKELSYATFRNRFNSTMEDLGMDHTIHETRHTFATLAKKYRLDDTMRQYLMGHITGSITDDVYTHPESLAPELEKEMRKICWQ